MELRVDSRRGRAMAVFGPVEAPPVLGAHGLEALGRRGAQWDPWGMPSLLFSSAQAELPGRAGDRIELFLRPELASAGFGWLVPIYGSRLGRFRRYTFELVSVPLTAEVLRGVDTRNATREIVDGREKILKA